MRRRDPKKTELIEAVQKLGRSMNALAESEAIQAVRFPGNKSYQETAGKAVLKSDTYRAVSEDVIRLIEKHWPDGEAS